MAAKKTSKYRRTGTRVRVRHARPTKRKVYYKLKQTKHKGASSKKADRKRKALKPGKRRSSRGNDYWETRDNRSDRRRFL